MYTQGLHGKSQGKIFLCGSMHVGRREGGRGKLRSMSQRTECRQIIERNGVNPAKLKRKMGEWEHMRLILGLEVRTKDCEYFLKKLDKGSKEGIT